MWAAPIGRGGLSVVDIKCSRCGGHATFDGELFEFYPVHKKLPAEIADSGKAIYQWSGSYVIEHYPNLVKWNPSAYYAGGSQLLKGIIKCSQCYLVSVHNLQWPDDAYYQWDIRGNILWAYSTEHA